MAFRYINPGYKEWFDVTPYPSSMSNITDTSKSKTGTAFYNTDAGNYIRLGFPASRKIWCRFDFYIATTGDPAIYFGEFAGGSEPYNGFSFNISVGTSGNSIRLLSYDRGSWSYFFDYTNITTFGIERGKINSALFSLKWSDSEKGILGLTINNYIFDSIKSFGLTPYNNSNIRFTFRTNDILISNIIISDEEVTIKEQIIALSASATDTDMESRADGIYLSGSTGQTLLQNVDVADLANEYGSDSKITGLALIGNPAYRTGEGLASLIGITKSGNTITEHGKVALSESTDTVVQCAFNLSDTTVADLNNIQVGWKAGE